MCFWWSLTFGAQYQKFIQSLLLFFWCCQLSQQLIVVIIFRCMLLCFCLVGVQHFCVCRFMSLMLCFVVKWLFPDCSLCFLQLHKHGFACRYVFVFLSGAVHWLLACASYFCDVRCFCCVPFVFGVRLWNYFAVIRQCLFWSCMFSHWFIACFL